MTSTPYPLLFAPIFKDKVWGGRALEALGKTLPAGNIGESWELADLDSTSVSGGGGGAEHSKIINGPLAGKTIRDAVQQWGRDLLGATKASATRDGVGAFPLLVKFLDAREHLSIQVHPSPAYAKANPGANLKTECWYILHTAKVAGPGGQMHEPVIFKGLKPGVTRADLERAIREERVPEVMQAVPAIVGECHNLPSGTIHALGAGVVVAEVQTPSDTTFRVYDWAKEYGRKGRELHVAQSVECTDFGPAPALAKLAPGAKRGRLVTTEFFRVDEVRLKAGESIAIADSNAAGASTRAHAFTVLAGSGAVRTAAGDERITRGQTGLVPAALVPGAVLVATSDVTALVVDVS
ncbi:MAG: class I mannose-6-phosphate isomerase [Phycisphaerales bacterium]|nr:class I mannose-6-phosphate isomerase [Phycisphaerales bacterium]